MASVADQVSTNFKLNTMNPSTKPTLPKSQNGNRAKPLLGAVLFKWFRDLFYSTCQKCGKKGVSFSHEEHFTPGSPNVYTCKYCKTWFVIL